MDEAFVEPGFADFPLNLHQAMLEDKRRLAAFQRAIRRALRPGDTVVDVGTGTGILAFMAYRAGAGRVIAIDRSDIVETAKRVKADNFPDAPIEFHQIDALSEPLPRVKADLLVCELIGNFGLEEQIIPVVRRVRERMLRPGAKIIPGYMELVFAPVQSGEIQRRIDDWREPIAGVDFSAFGDLAYDRVYHVDGERMTQLAKPDALLSIDFANVAVRPRRLDGRFAIDRAGRLHGIGSWFRAVLVPGEVLESDPRKTATHWGQMFFPVAGPQMEPIRVRPGAIVEFQLTITPRADHNLYRWKGCVHPAKGDPGEPVAFSHAVRDQTA